MDSEDKEAQENETVSEILKCLPKLDDTSMEKLIIISIIGDAKTGKTTTLNIFHNILTSIMVKPFQTNQSYMPTQGIKSQLIAWESINKEMKEYLKTQNYESYSILLIDCGCNDSMEMQFKIQLFTMATSNICIYSANAYINIHNKTNIIELIKAAYMIKQVPNKLVILLKDKSDDFDIHKNDIIKQVCSEEIKELISSDEMTISGISRPTILSEMYDPELLLYQQHKDTLCEMLKRMTIKDFGVKSTLNYFYSTLNKVKTIKYPSITCDIKLLYREVQTEFIDVVTELLQNAIIEVNAQKHDIDKSFTHADNNADIEITNITTKYSQHAEQLQNMLLSKYQKLRGIYYSVSMHLIKNMPSVQQILIPVSVKKSHNDSNELMMEDVAEIISSGKKYPVEMGGNVSMESDIVDKVDKVLHKESASKAYHHKTDSDILNDIEDLLGNKSHDTLESIDNYLNKYHS